MSTRKKIIITGASGGIGRATALLTANSDVLLFLQANGRIAQLEETAEICRSQGAQVHTFRVDFFSEKETLQFCDDVRKTDQSVPFGAFIGAAGLDLMAQGIRDLSFDEKLNRIFAIDVLANIRMTRFWGKWLRAESVTNNPTIVLFGWDGVERGMEGETAQLYSVAKGAVIAFMKSLAQDLAPIVRVCSVSPGWIQTTWGANPSEKFRIRGEKESLAQRWGTPDEVARLVRFLISNDASFINGQDIPVNGGHNYSDRS